MEALSATDKCDLGWSPGRHRTPAVPASAAGSDMRSIAAMAVGRLPEVSNSGRRFLGPDLALRLARDREALAPSDLAASDQSRRTCQARPRRVCKALANRAAPLSMRRLPPNDLASRIANFAGPGWGRHRPQSPRPAQRRDRQSRHAAPPAPCASPLLALRSAPSTGAIKPDFHQSNQRCRCSAAAAPQSSAGRKSVPGET